MVPISRGRTFASTRSGGNSGDCVSPVLFPKLAQPLCIHLDTVFVGLTAQLTFETLISSGARLGYRPSYK
jgi:hypothetical protein